MNVVPLREVLVSLESGTRPAGGVSADSGEIASIGGEHLDANGCFDFKSIKRIPRSFFETMRGGQIKPGDILVVKDGATTGKTSLVREDFPFSEAAVNEHVFCVRVDPTEASPEYVFQFLRSPMGQKAIYLDFRGATVGGISREFATKTRIPLPSISEQRRIAQILGRTDVLRAKRRAAIAQLDTLTQSIFLNSLLQAGNSVATVSIEDGMEAIIDYRGKSPNKTECGVPLITARVVKNGGLLEPTEFIAETDYASWMRRGLPRTGDVVFTTEAPLGEVAQLDGSKVALAQRLLVLRGKREIFENIFLKHALTAQEVRKQINARATGSTVRGIRQRELRKVMLPMPPIELQREFGSRVTAVEKLKAVQRASMTKLDRLFTSLQDRAFQRQL